ncbi:CdaR family protein [Lutispora thermophila]|uniref:YbbR domain-containing protein n=1 Tax=Lutispora thermophila DSM 19022 TaxID=1122184 RepID=A0A1M6I2W4_9FIRM|nr:CdaR family protein [Lutispora thermophila]SHJ28809.1 YbbR domain-containing protein [Lutispora thermophila DSM 19022]
MNNILNKNITYKILSVLLATMLWLYVITDQNPVVYKDITLPVRLIGVETLGANNVTLLDKTAYSVSMKLKGNKNTLDRINNTSINATADLRDYKEKGEYQVPIQISGVPAGVDITSMSTNSIKVRIDNVVSVTMPVVINITGNPAHGMAAMTPTIDPGEVTIKGAESLVNKVKTVAVDLDISSSSSTIKKNIPVRILNEKGEDVNNVEVSPKTVDIEIPIEYTKIVNIEPDVTVTPAAGYIITNIYTNPREIHIVGKKELLDGLDSVKTERVEFKDAKAFVDQQVSLILPEGIELANRNEKIRLNINIEKIIEKTIEINNIAIRNLPENLIGEHQQIAMKLTVKGPESVVNAWNANNSFYVDVEGFSEGLHEVSIMYNKPDEIQILHMEPSSINVTLKSKGVDNSDASRNEGSEASH